ncbi:MAG TPA: UDP-glucose--hexose-1-phosphate uridylyltransferase [Candidatus Limnocylindrales bacterium]|nr:UDP-glucose--hexose-1-phosphate uridylyltransferase [Candidatus Limnocylindrales bacterium]
MSVDDLATLPHRRYNPLLDEWVLVSAGRTQRPWLGRRERPAATPPVEYDPSCYLCPGNARANGAVNPDYEATFVFTNDFAALRPDVAPDTVHDGLLEAEVEPGTCRVLCFARRHDLTMAAMAQPDVRRVVDLWADETADLGRRFQWVQIFENRGEAMGASNPHPHGQIWAGAALPNTPAREDRTQRAHLAMHGTPLLLDYVAQESGGPRVVVENDDWLVVVPFWAQWPFEVLLVARAPTQRLPDLDDRRRDTLAATLIELLGGYDRLFDLSFPYSMGWHQAPFRSGSADEPHWQLHAHFLPPLLDAEKRKFMIGYELLAETQRDLTPEQAAEQLRAALAEDAEDADDASASPAAAPR